MDESAFEGSLVLEKLAQIGQLESFWEAVDADDLVQAKSLMKQAQVDAETVNWVLKMSQADDEH